MKTTLIKSYENKEKVQSKYFCLHKIGFLNKIQIAYDLIKPKSLLQVLINLNLFRL